MTRRTRSPRGECRIRLEFQLLVILMMLVSLTCISNAWIYEPVGFTYMMPFHEQVSDDTDVMLVQREDL